MAPTRLAYLFQKYFDKKATPEEAAEFLQLTAMDEHAAEVQELMDQSWATFDNALPVFNPDQSHAILQSVLARSATPTPKSTPAARTHRIPWTRIAAAAMLASACGAGAWWFSHRQPLQPPQVAQARPVSTKADPKPSGNKAVLILDDGSSIALDSAHTGALTTQGNTRVIKVENGRLAYNGLRSDSQAPIGHDTRNATVLFNTIRTPRGGQYQVTLPDGSRVWLNAASALRFPTAFNGKDRTVELTGEAYFEIEENKAQPFHVRVNDMVVDVLGTHFNIMAYEDEGSFNTTLIQGAVRVQEGAKARILRPGQEARLGRETNELLVETADTDQVVAWKNGLFQFEGATLETVMRQMGRWYDVDIRYDGVIRQHFSGMIPRSTTLPQVLHILGRTGKARFSLEGRTVVVSPM